MLTARMFGGLALVLAVPALLWAEHVTVATDLYLHDTYYVVGPRFPLLFGAIVSAIMALVCFAAIRWASRPLNRLLVLISFVLIALAYGVYLTVGYRVSVAAYPAHWQIWTLIGAMFSFIVGCLIFAINVIWTLIRLLSVHFSMR
ncbi:MAG TPA: hypothetical protein VGT03_07135 [Candidatus Acidoferrales bacterium]|nr:hypothetical protein [Candidatus Acidoferrales bacterium]